MIVYRAMCKEEYESTIKNKSPDFKKRFKWFAINKDFIKHRVKDGRFNNSKFKQGAYEYVLMFDADISKADFVSKNEVQFDRRRNPKIDLIDIIDINN